MHNMVNGKRASDDDDDAVAEYRCHINRRRYTNSRVYLCTNMVFHVLRMTLIDMNES